LLNSTISLPSFAVKISSFIILLNAGKKQDGVRGKIAYAKSRWNIAAKSKVSD